MGVTFIPGPATSRPTGKYSKPISLDHKNLTDLKESSLAQGIQRDFCTAIKAPEVCPECVEKFAGAQLYRNVLNKPFLLVDSEENGFGGYFMVVVFMEHPQVYSLWVYRLSSGEFIVREIEPFIKLNKALMDELARPDYVPYLLSACKKSKIGTPL